MVDIQLTMVVFASIVISLTIHEYAHAWMADRLGDPTPQEQGRLTMNPIVLFREHPFGALLVPLIGALQGFGIGWAATPVNPARVRRGISVRTADFLISIAGPVSNLLQALVCLVFLVVMKSLGIQIEALLNLAFFMVIINVVLFVLNMIPVPPLDGFSVLQSLVPQSPIVNFLKEYGLIILIIILLRGSYFFGPIIDITREVIFWALR